jgi:hypothetical protein
VIKNGEKATKTVKERKQKDSKNVVQKLISFASLLGRCSKMCGKLRSSAASNFGQGIIFTNVKYLSIILQYVSYCCV